MDSNELNQKPIHEFDIFATQIFLKCTSLDEIIVGYFFGKKNENLEFIFYNFPASVQKLLPNINHNPHLHFKEELTKTVNKLVPDHPEIVDRSAKLMEYVTIQFQKIGGLERFSKRLSYLSQQNELDEINMELLGLFDYWVEKKELQFKIEFFLAEDYSKKVLESAEFFPEKENFTNYFELSKMAEFYPLIDPIQGIPIDAFEVGTPLKITILSYPDEQTETIVKNHYQDYLDVKEGYLKPIEADIVSKELLTGKKDTYVLVKVRLMDDLCAYSIMLRSLKLNNTLIFKRNLLPPVPEEEDTIPTGEERVFPNRIKKETHVIRKLKEKARFKFADLMLILVILGGSIALIALISDLLSKK